MEDGVTMLLINKTIDELFDLEEEHHMTRDEEKDVYGWCLARVIFYLQ
jgi:hypothetical protein